VSGDLLPKRLDLPLPGIRAGVPRTDRRHVPPVDRCLRWFGRDDLAGLGSFPGHPRRRHVLPPPGEGRRGPGQGPGRTAQHAGCIGTRDGGAGESAAPTTGDARATDAETNRATPPSRAVQCPAGICHPGRADEPSGQDAIAAGYFDAAVVAFRKCAYLTPHDPLAQLHLGLALEAAGDDPSAQRAYAAARHALGEADLSFGNAGLKGYSGAELKSLLDAKNRRLTR
jgi:hypothetical protein